MMASSLLVIHSSPRYSCVISPNLERFSELKEQIVSKHIQGKGFYVTCNGRLINEEDQIKDGSVYHCVPTVLGGKGGFGSMLRAIGAQIEKTTSREACRDLSGRRMRDVNNEKKLKEWLGKQADREREKEERRQERLVRRRTQGQHNFDDPTYVEQRSKVADDLEDALQTGLQKDKAAPSSDVRGKRKADSKGPGKAKRAKEWLGVDLDDLSSSSDEDSSSSGEPLIDSRISARASESENSQDGASTSQSTSENSEMPSTSYPTMPVHGEKTSDSHSEPPQSDGQGEITQSSSSQGETTHTEKKSSLLASLPPPQNLDEKKHEEKTELKDIDLEDFSSACELEELGLETLKFALTQRGLKCGGTLQQRAERLFSVKGLTRDQIDPALFPKAPGKGKK